MGMGFSKMGHVKQFGTPTMTLFPPGLDVDIIIKWGKYAAYARIKGAI